MCAVWRPERRNRKIGTAEAGWKKSNDMRIPESWTDRHGNFSLYYERLDAPEVREVSIGPHVVKILFEPARPGCFHPVSPEEATDLLGKVAGHLPGLPDMLVFRQPTRKQRLLKPVWGRFLYWAEIGEHHGTAILLEAQEEGAKIKWSRRMTPEDRAEFDRLVADGHAFKEEKRHFVTRFEPGAARQTVLYRTLLHELGHWAHYQRDVETPDSALDPDEEIARNLFFAAPSSEREAFAHGFADGWAKRLGQSDAE